MDYNIRFKKTKMDCRCPRKLVSLPTEPCEKALEAIYTSPVESQGCPWYIHDADSNYCFFAYNAIKNDTHTLLEVSEKLVLPMATIDIVEKQSLLKLRETILKKKQ